jgi:serine/threonine-protein kinase
MDDRPRTLAGRYELGEVIGRGGMGTVYRATDRVLGREVAVKVLLGQIADRDPLNIERFAREARAAAALSHRGVVAVYDTGIDAMTRYIVMELIEGRSLEAILREQGPLDPGRAADIVAQVADALAAAHAAGLVHRDIKPANLMIAGDGSVKILDFGIARAMDSTTLTQGAAVLGTAAYMSPEQALGQRVDERSDIYSLGCVLYALLAGHPPFHGETAAAILSQHANVAPPRLPGIAPELQSLVLAMLSKAPPARPQSAAAVRDRLRGAVTSGAPARDVTPATLPMTQSGRSHRRPGRARELVPGLLAAAALVAIVAVLASGGGATRIGTTARQHTPTAARANTNRRASTKRRPRTTTPAARSTTTGAAPTTPLTVSGAAGTLTALTTQDVESETIDQAAAKQISGALSDLLNSYQQGNAPDVQHKLADLAQHLSMLEQHGDIQPPAAPAIQRAVANLAQAMAANPVAPSRPSPPAKPPGHGSEPPGQAKKDKGKKH